MKSRNIAVSGFVFDMWRIYEDFVCVALAEAFRAYGGHASLQYRMHLDEALAVKMRPDFVWSRQGAPVVVVDAKYKAEKPAGFPQADLYQVLAYCTVLGLQDGHLVYAKGSEVAAVHEIAGSPVRVHCHALDISLTPANVLDQVEAIARSCVRSAQTGTLPRRFHGRRHA